MALFNRKAQLIVGQSGKQGLLIEDLRIEFKIEKTASETLNSSTVRIYNLNADSRNLVETPNNAIILKAGYEQDIGAITIFVGIVRRSLTIRDGCDWITELELDDGLLAYRDSKASTSFAPGTKASDVLRFVAGKFGLPVRPLPDSLSTKTYPNGFNFVGKVRESMGNVCKYMGLEWSIQNQEIQIIKKGGHVKRTAIVISTDTGMIGSPELEAKTMSEKSAAANGITANSAGVIKKKSDKKGADDNEPKEKLEIQGYKVSCLLQPTIEPGSVIKLQAEGVDNFFKVEKVTHSGDTHGTDWKTETSVRFI